MKYQKNGSSKKSTKSNETFTCTKSMEKMCHNKPAGSRVYVIFCYVLNNISVSGRGRIKKHVNFNLTIRKHYNMD